MKNSFKVLFVSFIMLISGIVLFACGEDPTPPSLVAIQIDQSQTDEIMVTGTTPTITYKKVYSNNSVVSDQIAQADEITVNGLGEQTLTITVEGKTDTCSIMVCTALVKNSEELITALSNLTHNSFIIMKNADYTIAEIDINNTSSAILINKNNVTLLGLGNVRVFADIPNNPVPSFLEITGNNVTLNNFSLFTVPEAENAIYINGGKNVTLTNLTIEKNSLLGTSYLKHFAGTVKVRGQIENLTMNNLHLNLARIDVSEAIANKITLNNSVINFVNIDASALPLFPFYKGTSGDANIETLSGSNNYVLTDERMDAYSEGNLNESYIINLFPIVWQASYNN